MRVNSIFHLRLECQACLEFSFKMLVDLITNLLDFSFSYHTLGDKLFGVATRLSFHRSDLFVHYWLSKTRFIDFVVTVESKTNHVNQNVFLKCLPILNHKLWATNDWFGVTCVYSKNWYTERFNNIWRIFETTIILRTCRKSNLIICDYVKATVTSKFGQLAQGKRFVRGSLSWERSISMGLNIENATCGFTLSN
jgi:hypothetical protein